MDALLNAMETEIHILLCEGIMLQHRPEMVPDVAEEAAHTDPAAEQQPNRVKSKNTPL